MRLYLLLLLVCLLYGANSCQPPTPAFSPVPAAPQNSFNYDNQVQASKVEYEPFPGYKPPPPALPTDSLVPFSSRAGGVVQESNANAIPQPPLFNIPPPVGTGISLLNPMPLPMLNQCNEIKSISEFSACVQDTVLPREGENAWNCTFAEDTACRFVPVTQGFSVGRLQSPAAYVSLARFTNRADFDTPNGHFLYFVAPTGRSPKDEIIISTTINCQTDDGVLKFNYWLAPNSDVNIRVCTLTESTSSCTKEFVYAERSTATVQVVRPESDIFELQIVVDNMVTPTVFVIDDLQYSADTSCQKSEVPRNPLTLRNPEQVADDFFRDEDVVDESDVTGFLNNKDGIEQSVPSRPQISRQPPRARQPEYEAETEPDTEINDEDNEEYAEEERRPEVRRTSVTPSYRRKINAGSVIRASKHKKSACDLLRCNFEDDLCGWKNSDSITKNDGVWLINTASKKIDNQAEQGGGFVHIASTPAADHRPHKRKAFILESPEFRSDRNLTLLFDVYRRSDDATLQICFDSVNYCPIKLNPHEVGVKWLQDYSVAVPSRTNKVYFKAIQWKKVSWLALDNIRLENC